MGGRGAGRARAYQGSGLLDGFALCSDYCFNNGPFLSPTMFDDFVTPYLARLTPGTGRWASTSIKHTDGNIMPILDSLVSTQSPRPAQPGPAGRRGHRRGQAPRAASRCA